MTNEGFFMAMDLNRIKEVAPIVGIVLIVIVGLMAALALKATLKRKGIFKVYLKEPLEDHLGDPLNLPSWEKAKSFSTHTYFAKELMEYAIKLGTNNVKKRDRYTKEGEPTPMLQAAINESKMNMIQAFTNDGMYMSSNYCDFILNYRPYYTVGDFPKTINEYMAFCVNPNAFQKVERKQEEDESEQQDQPTPVAAFPSAFIDESQSMAIDDYEDEYIEPDDEGMSFTEDTVTPFKGSVRVGREVTMALATYAEKLARKTCNKKNIVTELNGVKTREYSKECDANYKRLSDIFLKEGYFKTEFVVWANSEYSDYGADRFEELIAPYLKHIKEK